MSISVSMTGISQTINVLSDYGLFVSHVHEKLQTALEIAIIAAQEYPPERDGQKYIRTFNLRDSWEMNLDADLYVSAINNVDYAHWVMGDDQAWMHVDRWRTIDEIERHYQDIVEQVINDGIQDYENNVNEITM